MALHFRRVFSCSWAYVDGLGGSINPGLGIKRRSSHPAVNGGLVNGYSEATLADDRLFAQWSLVARSRMAKNTLSIEITEQVSDNTLAHRWKQLKSLGVKIALDDFDQENSSLARLQNYDWDIAKFEVDLPTGFSDYQMVGIEECAGRGITMIAERIENKQQALTAKDAGLILQQGFLWAHPEIVTAQMPIVDKISA